jgi:hypothetical protein
MSTTRRVRAIAFARRELLALVEYHGVHRVFEKDGTSSEHWPRCLACEVLRTAGEDALTDLCYWLRERLYRLLGEAEGQEIEWAIGRLEVRFLEYLEDRRRLCREKEGRP